MATWRSGNAAVCKTATSRFDSDRRLCLGHAVARMVTAFAWRLLVAPPERRRRARGPAWAGDGGLVGADLSRDYCCTQSRRTFQATRRAGLFNDFVVASAVRGFHENWGGQHDCVRMGSLGVRPRDRIDAAGDQGRRVAPVRGSAHRACRRPVVWLYSREWSSAPAARSWRGCRLGRVVPYAGRARLPGARGSEVGERPLPGCCSGRATGAARCIPLLWAHTRCGISVCDALGVYEGR